jgi:lipoate-protein ligase A
MARAEELRVIASAGPPATDLAREAWLLERAAAGEPSLLLSTWPGPVVVLGFGQPAEDVDLAWCRRRGVPVLRRLTGGTGVVHRGDLGVGLALPAAHPWAKGIVSLYGRFLEALEPALRALGSRAGRITAPRRGTRVRSPVCFLDQLADTLAVDGRKAVGCAQTRRRGAVLVHGAILLGLDAELYARVFRVPEDEVRAGLAPALTGVAPSAVGEGVAAGMARALGSAPVHWPAEPVPHRFLEPYATARWAPVPGP